MGNVPSIRTKLRGVSSRNKSLQDVLPTLLKAQEIVSIAPHAGGIHNTVVVCKIQNDPINPIRTHFYNRLDLEQVIQGLTYTGSNIVAIITQLNLQGCDFNEDDLELVAGVLRAKDISLGYYNKNVVAPVACHCVLDNFTLDYIPSPLPSRLTFDHLAGELIIDEYTIDLMLHGVTYTLKSPPSEENVVADWMDTVISTNQLQNQISIDFLVNDSLRVKNLKAECGSFALTVTASGNSSVTGLGNDGEVIEPIPAFNEVYEKIHLVELCAKDQRKLVCDGLGDKIGFRQEVTQTLQFPEGMFTLQLNELILKHTLAVTPIMISLEDVLDMIVRSEVSWGYFNMIGTSGSYHRLLYNTTKDCLRIKLSFKATDSEEDITFFDHVLGTDEMGTVEGAIENTLPFIVEQSNT